MVFYKNVKAVKRNLQFRLARGKISYIQSLLDYSITKTTEFIHIWCGNINRNKKSLDLLCFKRKLNERAESSSSNLVGFNFI